MNDLEKLAIKRRNMALRYKEIMEELGEIKKRKAFDIIKLMVEHKTVAKSELYYQTTEDGKKELELQFEAKGLLELMRSIKTECDIKQSEAYNQY